MSPGDKLGTTKLSGEILLSILKGIPWEVPLAKVASCLTKPFLCDPL